uniref:F-box domain-containing protein n=1 Tax=Oryza glumipatula TaxID=40148 RepID=A0A0D9Z3M0_9ORYZ
MPVALAAATAAAVADQGRFNQLPDHILLSMLERVDMRTVLRTSVLSTRWKHLPLLLSDVDLDADEFIHQNSSMSADEAMAVLVKLMSSLFGSPRSESIIKKLNLRFCLLTDLETSLDYLFNIGELVCNAIDSGKVKSVELAITTEKRSSVMLPHETPPMYGKHLTLYYCELRDSSTLKLDMPNSKLRFVELNSCYVKTVEFLSLPKLEQLYCDSWRLSGAPLSFGVVPCLEELRLVCATSRIQSGFKLTDLLHGTANVQDIALDFQGEVIWITPEGKKLRSALNKITKLFLHGIYVKFDLLWTLVLLESAPSVKVWNHACDDGTENRKQLSERRNDLWDAAQLDGSIHYLQLERLEFGGFNQIIRKHLDFIRAIIERAPNFKSVILEDRDPCED